MASGPFRHHQRVAGVLLVIGGLLAALGLAGGHLGTRIDRETLMAAGLSLVLAGCWQLWTQLQTRRVMDGLTDQLRLMASVARHTGSPVLVTDNDLGVVWCNEAFVRETGYSLDEVRGQHPGRWLRSPEADPVAVERIRDALRDHTDIDIELLHRYRDDRDRWVRLIISSQRDDQGRASGFVAVLVDIDRQVRTQVTLQQTVRHKDALMQSLDEYMIVAEVDVQGRLTRVNQRFQEISGYSEAELVGQGFGVVSSGWHTPTFWRNMWFRIGRGFPWRGEICNRSKEGRLYWVQTLIAPLVGADGQVEKYVAIQLDISEQRLAQIELNKSQSMLTRTSQLAGVGGWYALPGSNTLHVTPECLQLLGAEVGDIRTLDDFWKCFDAGARLVVRDQLKALVDHQRAEVDLVAPLRSTTGSPTRWVKMLASYRVAGADDKGRRSQRIIGAVQDYTQQVQSQQRIREEQRILHSAMDAIGEAFALYDQDLRLVYFNDEYAAWLPSDVPARQGMRYDEVLGLVARRGDIPEAVGREAEWVQEVLHAPRKPGPDRVRQMGDGRWIRFIDRVTADGFRVVFRNDVTELQNALIQADAAALSKGQFLANMSHEIRTPINAIMGLLQLLGYTRLDAEQTDMVGKSLMATRSLLGILNDILDHSKIEAGMMQLHEVPFRLADLRHELEVILSGALGNKALDLVYQMDAGLPAVVVGDPVRLKQVLINLGGNAVKFTGSGRVTLRWRLLGREAGRVRIRFAVEDTGIGIAPEQQARIFDSFSQGESSTARRFGGSGLGLTISQRLVSFMGGKIALVSAPGQGSTFAFEVELAEGSEADVPLLEHSPAPGAGGQRLDGLRLLLVEDNPLNQEVALAMLRREGAAVVLAENGQQAVDALRADPEGFDLVLMDMQMPVLDGLQATEYIRDELGLRALPVLAMTANAMQADRERCLQAGMNAHIGKPFDIDQVVLLIRRFTGAAAVEPPCPSPGHVAERDEPPILEDEAALRRLGGQQMLLNQLRQRFLASAESLLRQAQACAARSEWSKAADAVHQLKGSAGVVGAERLALDCAKVEQALRACEGGVADGAGTSRLWLLEQPLRATLVALGTDESAAVEVPDATTDASTPGDSALEGCLADLRGLKTLLDLSDMSSIDQHEQWLADHPMARGARFEQLNALMEAMNLPAAGEACARLLDLPGGTGPDRAFADTREAHREDGVLPFHSTASEVRP